MNRACRGNTAKLVAMMSGSLRPGAADRLREHLKGCPGCQEAYERLHRTQRLCRELGEAEPPSLPWRKIEAQIYWRLAGARIEDDRSLWPRRLVTFGVAAAVGALAALAVVWTVRPEVERTPAVVVKSPARVEVPPPEQELAAVPTMVQGEVFVVMADGRHEPLRLERPVVQGDRVVTGNGRAALQWKVGSGLLLAERSTVELRQLMSRTQHLHLEQGRMRLQLARLKQGERFAVIARGIRATVKGTVFDVAITETTVDVAVLEGRVHVDPVDGRWGVDVPGGFEVRVPFGADQPPAVVRRTGADNSPGVHLVPWPSLARMMATTGLLTLETQPPGADLLFDSRRVGTTNLALRGSPGRHLIELYRDGRLVEKRWVDVAVAGPITMRWRPNDRIPRLPPRIHNYIRQRSVQIRSCYERMLKRDPALEGRLTFRISIDPQGLVTETDLISDTFPDKWIGQCARQLVQRWQFPPGKAVQVVYPFIFKPQ